MSDTSLPNQVILFGSKKRRAREAAEAISQTLSIPCLDMSTVTPFQMKNCDTIIFSTATYGRGQPPPSCNIFWEQLSTITDRTYFDNLKFAILGIGDSRYPTFLGFAKLLRQKMIDLGATEITEMAHIDRANEDLSILESWPKTILNKQSQ